MFIARRTIVNKRMVNRLVSQNLGLSGQCTPVFVGFGNKPRASITFYSFHDDILRNTGEKSRRFFIDVRDRGDDRRNRENSNVRANHAIRKRGIQKPQLDHPNNRVRNSSHTNHNKPQARVVELDQLQLGWHNQPKEQYRQ